MQKYQNVKTWEAMWHRVPVLGSSFSDHEPSCLFGMHCCMLYAVSNICIVVEILVECTASGIMASSYTIDLWHCHRALLAVLLLSRHTNALKERRHLTDVFQAYATLSCKCPAEYWTRDSCLSYNAPQPISHRIKVIETSGISLPLTTSQHNTVTPCPSYPAD